MTDSSIPLSCTIITTIADARPIPGPGGPPPPGAYHGGPPPRGGGYDSYQPHSGYGGPAPSRNPRWRGDDGGYGGGGRGYGGRGGGGYGGGGGGGK